MATKRLVISLLALLATAQPAYSSNWNWLNKFNTKQNWVFAGLATAAIVGLSYYWSKQSHSPEKKLETTKDQVEITKDQVIESYCREIEQGTRQGDLFTLEALAYVLNIKIVVREPLFIFAPRGYTKTIGVFYQPYDCVKCYRFFKPTSAYYASEIKTLLLTAIDDQFICVQQAMRHVMENDETETPSIEQMRQMVANYIRGNKATIGDEIWTYYL